MISKILIFISLIFTSQGEGSDRFTAPKGSPGEQYIAYSNKCFSDLCRSWQIKESSIPWRAPCTLEITILKEGSEGGSADRNVKIIAKGTDTYLKYYTLPHEIFHTIIYSLDKRYPPPWVNEGLATLTERPDLANRVFNKEKAIPLARFSKINYASLISLPLAERLDFYAQSHFLLAYLLKQKDEITLIRFARSPDEATLIKLFGLKFSDLDKVMHGSN
jgi:hypothetical protein